MTRDIYNASERQAFEIIDELRKLGGSGVINHPQTCIVIRDETDTSTYTHKGGDLAVFTDSSSADEYILKVGLKGARLNILDWEELVDKFGSEFTRCLVDHKAEPGYYTICPLVKGI